LEFVIIISSIDLQQIMNASIVHVNSGGFVESNVYALIHVLWKRAVTVKEDNAKLINAPVVKLKESVCQEFAQIVSISSKNKKSTDAAIIL